METPVERQYSGQKVLLSGYFSRSAILSEEFARGAQEAGCSVEKVMAARKKLSGCLGVNAMEAGDIRKTDAMKQAYEMGRSV